MSNITYDNNSAPYGPNIASYAVGFISNYSQSDLLNLASGQPYNGSIYISIIDSDDQILNMDSSSVISLYFPNNTA